MVRDFTAVYEKHTANAEIAASGNAIYFSDTEDKVQLQKANQSFNYLEIINDSSIVIEVYLDGLATRKRLLFGKTALIMKPEESIYFNTVKLTNTDAASAITAGEVQLIARALKPTVN